MIHPTPRWTFTSRFGLRQWYGHVILLPDKVLGQWWCVERANGTVLWERTYQRPNTIDGITGEVIVASETRSDGPWTAAYGCYGLSLKTGERLWTSHREGLWGWVMELIDLVPGITNEFRDTAVLVRGAECICESGRVLDARTGRLLRRMPREDVERLRSEASESRPFLQYKEELPLAEQAFARVATGFASGPWNFFTYRFAGPYLYLVVSEEGTSRPHPREPGVHVSQRAHFHLLTLDRERATIIQDLRVGDEPLSECRIEDLDERGLALSLDGTELRYYERV
ncbi:hypothetical protein BO221_43080 [Archangium sp. Cb G35]|uniref:hypothetical protein n=1 Tax=Archangium sp. Cb G35 TaxID=1920190 RepID=UPI000937EADC|nr:hypothetical protein [Archangium sp. Cb G35]OJT17789.1 hypothetical protein BO221_43080 [Archangium sp. Cb G35]